MRRMSGRLAAVVAVVVLSALAVAACGSSSKSSSSGSSTSTGTSTSSSSSSAVASLWSVPNANVDGTRAVSSQISSSNVSQLKVAWTIPITGVKGLYGVFSSTPVFGPNGVAYLQDLGNNVYAVDVNTGHVIWKYKVPASDSNGEGPNGVTLVNGTVFGETNRQAFALQASTGEQLWRTGNLADKTGQGFNMAPAVIGGKEYVSTSGQLSGGVMYALNAGNGDVDWKFQETKIPSERKAGGPYGTGGAWGMPVVENGTVYIGVANPYRSIQDAIKHPTKLLYNDSTVALDAATGKLKWYYQAVPNDFHDWDMQIGPMYTAHGPNGQPTIIDSGKMGFVYAFNAGTGQLEWKRSVGYHNGHDNDARLALQGKFHPTVPYTYCPGIYGGVETQMAMAGGVVYVPANNLCSTFTSLTKPIADKTQNFTKGTGDFEAIDVDTGSVEWDTKLPSSPYGSATVTNDLVFTTTFNGKLIAMNRNTGKIVWSQQLSAGTNSALAIDGDTLITAASFPSGAGQKAEIVAYRLSSTSPSGSSSGGTATSGSTATNSTTSTSANTSTSSGGGSSSGVSLKEGMHVFETAGCASCHTLAAAGSTGTVGPNLDQLKPSDAAVVKQVTNGGGGMPAFGSSLSKAQINSVALYVSSVAGKPVKHPVKKQSGGGP
jgi:outer membrane protein assembly factor BamB